ncbi:MAG: hypothetical protein ACRELD_04605 [Longimicrobiales bacterium]
MMRHAAAALTALALLVAHDPLHSSGALDAQQANRSTSGSELELLRMASDLENAGDLGGAADAYRAVLDQRPASLSALISLERLLRVQGDLDAMIPVVERHLHDAPGSAIGHQMLLRIHAEADRPEAFADVAETWIEATPTVETPYREIARLFEAAGDYAGALRTLERGRDRLGGPSALALELGGLHAAMGDARQAAREWSRAVGEQGEGFLLVERRASSLPDGGARVLPLLVRSLVDDGASLPRRRAAAVLAIEAGLEADAGEIAVAVADRLAGGERQGFLVEVARRSEGAQLPRVAYWAYSELLEGDEDELESLAIRSRLAELALLLGDTTAARQSLAALEAGAAYGSIEQRRAAARQIMIAIDEGGSERAQQELVAFRERFPQATELDDLSAALAERQITAGQFDAATTVIQGVRGPRTDRLRGRLALARGDARAARIALLAAAPGLYGAEATEAIELARLLGRLSDEGARVVADALRAQDTGTAGEAVVELLGRSSSLPTSERPALLDFAADFADRAGLGAEAEQIRRTLILEHPDAFETPPALLALARALAARPDGLSEAQQLLERLVLEYPRSALVPQARRELDRIQGRVPRS